MKLAVLTSHGAANATSTVNNSTTVTQVATTIVTANNANNAHIKLEGLIRMDAGGTVTPQINFSGTAGGTPAMLQDSYIMFTPMGTNTVESIGNVA
jgi:uncharacterized lipoprotein NlpE involved in copper resistance